MEVAYGMKKRDREQLSTTFCWNSCKEIPIELIKILICGKDCVPVGIK